MPIEDEEDDTIEFATDVPADVIEADDAEDEPDGRYGTDRTKNRTTLPCSVHLRHKPKSNLNEIHHVWPVSQGGPRSPENTVIVCATGHRNLHVLLRMLRAYNGVMPWSEAKRFGRRERAVAALGYDRMTRKAL